MVQSTFWMGCFQLIHVKIIQILHVSDQSVSDLFFVIEMVWCSAVSVNGKPTRALGAGLIIILLCQRQKNRQNVINAAVQVIVIGITEMTFKSTIFRDQHNILTVSSNRYQSLQIMLVRRISHSLMIKALITCTPKQRTFNTMTMTDLNHILSG